MSLARDVTTVGSATLASRLLGFARDVGIAAVLGAGVSFRRVFRGPADRQPLPSAAGRGRAQRRLRAVWLRIKQTQGESGAYAILPAGIRRDAARGRRAGGDRAAVRTGGHRPARAGLRWGAPCIGGGLFRDRCALCRARRHRRRRRRGSQCAGTRRRGGTRHRGVQRRPSRGLGMDRRLRWPAAVGCRRAAGACHRARRDRAAAGDRRRLPAPAAVLGVVRRSPIPVAPRRCVSSTSRRAGGSAFPPMRGGSSRSPVPALSPPASRS